MGVIASKHDRHQLGHTRRIEQQIRRQHDQDLATIKLLLLGAGECGKSTVLKQIQILHCDGFSEAERLARRPMLYSNVFTSITALCQAVKRLNIKYARANSSADAAALLQTPAEHTQRLDTATAARIARLWADAAVQRCYERRNEFQLQDTAKYQRNVCFVLSFLDNVERVAMPSYVPSEQDLLMLRVATTGIIEIKVNIRHTQYRVIDVGGQRSERRKWLHCFDNVQAVIFVIAVSEFDQRMREDEKTMQTGLQNRLHDALQLLATVLNSAWFIHTSFVVFLNKRDLFREKLASGRQFQQCFPDYRGHNTYEACMGYMIEKVHILNATEVMSSSQKYARKSYVHETCATDTNQVEVILDSVFHTILELNIRSSGM